MESNQNILMDEIWNTHIKIWCRVTSEHRWEIKKDTEIPVTEQVPYGKPTTEALGWLAGGPANKRLAKAREEYLQGNWFMGARKLTER